MQEGLKINVERNEMQRAVSKLNLKYWQPREYSRKKESYGIDNRNDRAVSVADKQFQSESRLLHLHSLVGKHCYALPEQKRKYNTAIINSEHGKIYVLQK